MHPCRNESGLLSLPMLQCVSPQPSLLVPPTPGPADTVLMYQVPSSSDAAARRALRRLQEVSAALCG